MRIARITCDGCRQCTSARASRREKAARVILDRKDSAFSQPRAAGSSMATGDCDLHSACLSTILEPHALRIIAEQFTEHDAGGTLKGSRLNRFAYRVIYG